MRNILTQTNRLLTKLGPLNQVIDTLAEHLVPKVSAQACVITCGPPFCTDIRCGHFMAAQKNCYNSCTRRWYFAPAGCYC